MQRQSHTNRHTQIATPEHSTPATDAHIFIVPSHLAAKGHLSGRDRPGSHTSPRVPAPAAAAASGAGARSRCASGPSGNCSSFRKDGRGAKRSGARGPLSSARCLQLDVSPAEGGVPRDSVPAPLRPAGDAGRRRRGSRVVGRVSRACGGAGR